ncbi:N-6 DNA methylase [Streptacidiphilus fuscans]|uniref:N-6 DNA methylase n=1 Tax=Streptacidiphilus fuscans TaxID=2789292 RepID=A0A931BAV8_9ACTN|nr:N-6 DNA methylase [Streptacidiphilus fuscans]MBF9072241.1 N-6 DNA methylase [Streptacidiphilus fuscans]
MTAAEISRIAGVTRATVSNWRRRHADFPAPNGGTESSPLYELTAVQDWLGRRGHTSAASPVEELRTALRFLGGAADAARFFPLLLVAAGAEPEQVERLVSLTDGALAEEAGQAVAAVPDRLAPLRLPVSYTAADAGVLRALLACVREAGGQAALDVLASRELDEKTASGTYQTPEGLARLMAELLPADGIGRVLDPACGSGTLLVAAARRGARELYGQDSLSLQAQRAAAAVVLAEPPLPLDTIDVHLAFGDSLRADAFADRTVDAVLCNPPYGDRDWGHDELAYDPRWAYGLPPRFESELAWVQHALAHVQPGGHVVMLLPPATAFRTSGRRVRIELLRSGALRGVVSLPPRAAYPLHVALQLWILQRPDAEGAEHSSVLFVDASEGEQADTATRARLDWGGLAARLLPLWAAFRDQPEEFTDQPGLARAVSVIELLDEHVDVTPARHVRATAADVDPESLAARVTGLYGQVLERIGELVVAADEGGGWQARGEGAAERRSATVADLTRGGALTVLRATLQSPSQRDARRGTVADHSERRVLLVRDVASGGAPSGGSDDLRGETDREVAVGDVLIRANAGPGMGGVMARVATEADAGALVGPNLHQLRPDPSRIDPWFLAGFLGAEDNIAAASSGTTSLRRVNPMQLRIPLMPLAEQRRYGAAFQRGSELRVLARRTALLMEEAIGSATAGLTSGALVPPPGG